jgi:hypothetical protein
MLNECEVLAAARQGLNECLADAKPVRRLWLYRRNLESAGTLSRDEIRQVARRIIDGLKMKYA